MADIINGVKVVTFIGCGGLLKKIIIGLPQKAFGVNSRRNYCLPPPVSEMLCVLQPDVSLLHGIWAYPSIPGLGSGVAHLQ
jgi:hypothetical protein